MIKKVIKIILVLALVALVAIQFIRPEKNNGGYENVALFEGKLPERTMQKQYVGEHTIIPEFPRKKTFQCFNLERLLYQKERTQA